MKKYHIMNENSKCLATVKSTGPNRAYQKWVRLIGGDKVLNEMDTMIWVLDHSTVLELAKG